MEINFNLGSLKIVHTPLMEYFKKIQNNVSTNLVLIRDEKKVATNYEAIELLTKAQGTLKMIGLLGLVKVLQLCTDSLKDVKEVKFDTAKNIKILEACETSIKNVVLYLEILLIGELDQPTKLFTDYSNLAGLVGKKVSIKDLFAPRLEVKEETEEALQADLRVGLSINDASKTTIINVLKKAHSAISEHNFRITELLNKAGALSSVEEKNLYHGYCKDMYGVLTEVQNMKISKHVYVLTGLQKLFVCVTSPIFNDEVSKVIALGSDTIETNFAGIEKTLAMWIEEISALDDGDRTGVIKADDDITKEVVYFLINVLKDNPKLKDMPVFAELSTYFDFDFYSNQLKDVAIVSTIMQKNPELAAQIEKLFLDVKEELTLITSKQSNSEEFLVQHTTKFITFNQKLNEVLISAETKELSGILNALNAIFGKIKNKELKFAELLQKEVSLAVVLVEYGINTFIKSVVKDEDKANFSAQVNLQQKRLLLSATGKTEELAKLAIPVLDEKSKKSDERKAFLKIFQELSKEFLKAEAVLDQFLRNQEDGLDEIKEVFKSLKSARGIFAVIGKPELSKVVVEIIKVWEKILAGGIDAVDRDLLNHSIAWLSGISLIISASKDDNEVEANEVMANLLPKFNAYFKIEAAPEPILEPVIEIVKTVAPVVEVKPEIVKTVAPIVAAPAAKSASLYEDTPNDADLTEIYLMEAEEVLENMAVSLKAMDKNPNDTEEITNVRRYFHTLKGSGKMVGLKYLGEAGWIAEQTLNKVLSGDLKLNEGLAGAIRFAEAQFHQWVEELKAHNVVNVDLINFKKTFNPHNPHLTTTFEIPDEAPVAAAVEPVVEKAVEPAKDVLLVGDKEISTMLYGMFVEESTNHMQAMSQFVHNEDNLKGTIISSDFMLHAHTLASIARTVNLLDCAKIASKIELIANLALEKNIALNGDEMKVLCHAVDNLEKFRSVANGVQIDQSYVNSLIDNLSDLQESISNRNSIPKEQKLSTTSAVSIDMDALVEKLSAVMVSKEVRPAIDMDALVQKLSGVMATRSPAAPAIDVDGLVKRLAGVVAEGTPSAPAIDMNALADAVAAKLAPTLGKAAAPAVDMNALADAVAAKLAPTLSKTAAPAIDMKALTDSVTASLKSTIEASVAQINATVKASIEDSVAKINAGLKASLEDNVAKINKIHADFKAALEENVSNVNKSNAGFKSALEENVKQVVQANAGLKSSLEANVSKVNNDLQNLLEVNVKQINSALSTALQSGLNHVNSGVAQSLADNTAKVTATLNNSVEQSLSKVSSSIEATINSKLSEVKALMTNLQEEVSVVKAAKAQVVDSGKIASDIIGQVKSAMDTQYGELSKTLAENKYNTKEVVNELFNKIDTIETAVRKVTQEQQSSENSSQETLSQIRNDVKELNALIHKAASEKGGFLKGIFGK